MLRSRWVKIALFVVCLVPFALLGWRYWKDDLTPNPIEFINGRIRRTTHNVARWDGGEMVLRWLAVSVIEVAKTFRKLRGHRGMPKLVAALRAHDEELMPRVVDPRRKAA